MSPAIFAGVVVEGYLLLAGRLKNESWEESSMIRRWSTNGFNNHVCQPPARKNNDAWKIASYVFHVGLLSVYLCLHAMTAHCKRHLTLQGGLISFKRLLLISTHKTRNHTLASLDDPSRFVIFCHAKDHKKWRKTQARPVLWYIIHNTQEHTQLFEKHNFVLLSLSLHCTRYSLSTGCSAYACCHWPPIHCVLLQTVFVLSLDVALHEGTP